ncbi:hypothetical protein Dgeo_0936 [Deinococcus geothermalis DSM 11300]|uniref:Uncharacterized protein n=2 Tax=Deinococcus geothermalis TaxID=68909 RepID=Q1IZU7_DEIGD|nr:MULTISPECIES: hypothetical protein [Deinococcus]ABF45237.1 hypothetical protein Dgeo_0936 [Deinococcus geothermalis DSM 11300]MBI0444519.1 hypothetical protein [Deinococcus sp. DB0503]TDE86763.1 hypothetical protein E0686_05435 [Deinococcus sp. S9]
MQLLRRGHQFEYRDHRGMDQLAAVDVWTSGNGERAVLVLRELPGADLITQARRALRTLTLTWLPYLLRPDVQLHVLVLRPRPDETAKARALVLPLSA